MPDGLWERIPPLLPPRPSRRHRYPGRLPTDDRAALRGIVYVLRKNVSRRDVPAQRAGCSGVTARRRLGLDLAGVWPRLHEVLLAELRKTGLLDMDGAAIDGSHVRALEERLRIRYEIRADLDLGLLQLACSIICLRRLRTSF